MSTAIINEMNVEKLLEICGNLEKYQSYCHTLGEYISCPGTTIDGSSVPFYILQQFAYDQENLTSIKNSEMTKFVTAVADTACLLGTFPYYPGGLWEVSIAKPSTILSEKILDNLIQESAKDHTKVIQTKTQYRQIRDAIEQHVASSVRSLLRAIEGFYRACAKRQGLSTQFVWTKANNIDVSAIADDVMLRASKTNLKVLGSTEKEAVNGFKYHNREKKCFPSDGLCFSKNRSGFRFKISGRKDAPKPTHGFYDTQSDMLVKCKLGLLRGTVGFGWTQKSAFSREKTWGLFVHPPTYGY
ncbi:uncharacterized protein LOC110450115 [Mizuhopecten yessoensis]|uniref:uncharacterized protein LOC110450115 n=1 Tax=Mizuhopecten yessoensis TaxID=6573 RepID=UPI000B45E377|nr:uncharacterized protein LOC110450115 [Mizuhopecten yessoensis]